MSSSDIADRGNDLSIDEIGFADLVSGHLSPHPEQERDIQFGVGPKAWGVAKHGLEDTAQIDASDAGT